MAFPYIRTCIHTYIHTITLMLLGQIKAMSRRGMYAGFIDLRKAYDRADREKLWGCLESMGMGGRVSALVKAVYWYEQ